MDKLYLFYGEHQQYAYNMMSILQVSTKICLDDKVVEGICMYVLFL